MASITADLAGGLLATMLLGDGGSPPTARPVATFVGGDPADHATPGMLRHLVYGVVLGGFRGAGILA